MLSVSSFPLTIVSVVCLTLLANLLRDQCQGNFCKFLEGLFISVLVVSNTLLLLCH